MIARSMMIKPQRLSGMALAHRRREMLKAESAHREVARPLAETNSIKLPATGSRRLRLAASPRNRGEAINLIVIAQWRERLSAMKPRPSRLSISVKSGGSRAAETIG